MKVISRREKVKAQNGGKPCFGDGTKTEYCNIQDCPIVVQPQTTQFNNYGSQIGQQIGGFGGFGGGQFNNAKVKHEPSMGNWGGIGGGFMNGWRGFGSSMFNKRKKREADQSRFAKAPRVGSSLCGGSRWNALARRASTT